MATTRDKVEVTRRICDGGLIPVIRAHSAEMAMRVVKAIQNGSVSVIEITMTVPGAVDVIEALANQLGDNAVIGAGTVLDKQTAQACILAGAQFIVSPAVIL